MPSDATPGAGAGERLHVTSLIFSLGALGRTLLLPGIVLLFASRGGGRFELWLMWLAVPTVGAALVRYWTYRYRLDADELVVRDGIVTRNERHIPYSRIQNIDLVQNPLHRLFGVAEVRLETAGGAKPEATMRVLSLAAVEVMRERVFADRRRRDAAPGAAPADESPARLLHHLPPRELLLFGIISNRGMVVVAAALGLLWQFDPVETWWRKLSPDSLERLSALAPRGSPVRAVLLGLGALVAALILLRVLSIGHAFLRLYDFRLQRREEDLRSHFGLLTRISKTIPRRRIQVLTTRTTPLHRWFGRSAIRVQTAGSHHEEDGSSADQLWLAPLIPAGRVAELVREALPGLDLDRVEWQPVAAGAARRVFRPLAFTAVPLAGFGLWALGPWGLLPALLLVPWAYLYGRLYARHAAWAVCGDAILHRSGWVVRSLSVAQFGKIQAVTLLESPFDRRHRMACLQVDTAGAETFGQGMNIQYLEATTAARLRERLVAEAGRTAFDW